MSGVVVLNVLLRITVDISNNVTSLKYSCVLSFSYFSYFLSLTVVWTINFIKTNM